ncbi:hypothetical protein AJ79_01526 [Helicocarpus griseus UAMH5409]|uniref:Uncharacterized protein n=1 Tax=Helicocarpus griseus UAMH5409 TaxID=1447875 RepID=A0A2B7Y7M6_9EURO|nr:hypothetical protein AJ79_01526 [Helicocarpus griseus UAMH5409]
MSKAFKAAAIVFTLLSAGHTLAGKQWMTDPQFKALPRHVGAFSRVGWYQGSVFLLIGALLNYRWSQTSRGALTDPVEKAMAALATALCFGSSAWYNKNGIRDTAAIVGFAGVLQGYAAFFSKA